MTVVYHSTTAEAAEKIEAVGFRDNPTGSFNRDGELCRGVWLADRDVSAMFRLGGVVFAIDVPEDLLAEHEWLDDPGPWASVDGDWRAFLIPSNVLNAFRRVRTVQTPVHTSTKKHADLQEGS